MPRLPSSLREVGCRKPNCSGASGSIQRHHKRHQAMWIGVWIGRRKGEEEFEAFLRRYWQFKTEDIVKLCAWHHAEIHQIYDGIIFQYKLRIAKPLYKCTWAEAEELMQLLEDECERWLLQNTPGYDPEQLRLDRLASRLGGKPVQRSKKRKTRRRKRKKKRSTPN